MNETIFAKPGETFEKIITSVDEGYECDRCDAPIVQAIFVRENGGRHSDWRHADGTPNHPTGDDYLTVCDPKPRCGKCGKANLTFDDRGYGTLRTCGGCGDEHWTDRGD